MEEDCKIIKVEFFSNQCSDLPQILNCSSGNQIKHKKALNEDKIQWEMTSQLETKTKFGNYLYQDG
jgi:hypothetical protein